MLFVNGSHVRAHARGVSVLYDQQARSVEGGGPPKDLRAAADPHARRRTKSIWGDLD